MLLREGGARERERNLIYQMLFALSLVFPLRSLSVLVQRPESHGFIFTRAQEQTKGIKKLDTANVHSVCGRNKGVKLGKQQRRCSGRGRRDCSVRSRGF